MTILSPQLSPEGQKLLFTDARTHHAWQPKPVDKSILHQIYDLMKWAPTSFNAQPVHIVFLSTDAAKARLLPCLQEGNVAHTKAAPVTAIIAYDKRFYEHLPKNFPAFPTAKDLFETNPTMAANTGLLGGSMQGAYFIMATRAMGLDACGMSGFDNAKVDKEFFPDEQFKSIFLCNVGYGDAANIFPRGPRHDVNAVCKFL